MQKGLQEKWREYEGHLWYRTRRGHAYWKLCRKCNNTCYPEVHRNRNGSSNPPPVYFDMMCPAGRCATRHGSVLPKTMGDFYLNLPPPERITPDEAKAKTADWESMHAEVEMTVLENPSQDLFPLNKRQKKKKDGSNLPRNICADRDWVDIFDYPRHPPEAVPDDLAPWGISAVVSLHIVCDLCQTNVDGPRQLTTLRVLCQDGEPFPDGAASTQKVDVSCASLARGIFMPWRRTVLASGSSFLAWKCTFVNTARLQLQSLLLLRLLRLQRLLILRLL